jgi:hypothetical protein
LGLLCRIDRAKRRSQRNAGWRINRAIKTKPTYQSTVIAPAMALEERVSGIAALGSGSTSPPFSIGLAAVD